MHKLLDKLTMPLYELTHRQGQVVMKVTWVNNWQRWRRLAWPPRLWVRAKDGIGTKRSDNILNL